ncbi:MAG: hypothetical protein ABIS20_01220 [Thermoanaerobaculia bacterium]
MASPGRKKGVPKEKPTLSAVELAKQSGVPYRLVAEYTKRYETRVSHIVDGMRVKYFPRAIAELQQLRREERARRQVAVEFTEADAYNSALGAITIVRQSMSDLTSRVNEAERLLRAYRPVAAATIHTLPEGYRPRLPISVLLEPEGKGFMACIPDVRLDASGRTREEAVQGLRGLIVTTIERLEKREALSDEEGEQLNALLSLVDTQ